MKLTTEKKFFLSKKGFTLYSNQGSLSQRWFIYYYKKLPAGVNKRKRIYGGINRHTSPEKRYKAACDLLNKVLAGSHSIEEFESINLQGLFSQYFEQRCKNLRVKTRFTYLTKVNAFLDYCGKKRIDTLAAVTKKTASAFIQSINKSPTTRNSYRDTLRTFFEDFKRDKLIEENPFAAITKAPEARRGKFPFNTQQIAQLKNEISKQNAVLWFGCMLEYYCFIRPGEMRLIKVEDVNLAEDFILIHASLSKNKKTQPVSIPTAFKPIIEKWLKALPQNFYILNKSAVAVGNNYLNKSHAKILRKLGFGARFSFYSWKHTGAFMAIKAGVSLKDLQMQMRHHSLDQLNEYLREMGVMDSATLKKNFPEI